MSITATRTLQRLRQPFHEGVLTDLSEKLKTSGPFGPTILLLVLLAVPVVASNTTKKPPVPAASGFIVVSTPEGIDALYFADQETGGIYFLKSSNETQINVSQFTKFFQSSKYANISGLAYRNGKLLVCDQAVPALFEIDIPAQEASINRGTPLNEPSRVLLEGAPLQKPVGVAVSERGLIAIADETLRGIVWYDATAGAKAVRYDVDDPKIAFDSSDLLVLDRRAGTVFSMPQAFSLDKVRDRLTPLLVPAGDKIEKHIEDIATFNGLYYLAGSRRLISFHPQDFQRDSTAFYSTASYSKTLDAERVRLGASKNAIYIEVSGDSIVKVARPTFANVSLRYDQNKPTESVSSNHQAALLSVYEYLYSHEMLPLREAKARDANQSVVQLLLAEKVWIPGATVKRERPDRAIDPLRRRLALLLCKLNGWSASLAEANSNAILDRVLKPGEGVVVPRVSLKRSLTTSPVHLGGRTVEEHLAQRVYTEQLSDISAQYLYEINAQYKNADSLLSRDHFISAFPPESDLKPGSLLKFSDSGKQTLLGNVRDCGVHLEGKEEKRPYFLPRSFSTSLSNYQWPKVPGIPSSIEGLSNLGISDVEVRYRDPKAERIKWDSVAGQLDKSEVRDCIAQMAGNDSYLVTEAVKVDGAKYRFSRKDGSPRPLSSGDRGRLNLEPQTDPYDEWQVSTGKDFYIGYKLLRITNPDQPDKWYPASDTTRIIDKYLPAIFREKLGFLNLPLTAWDMDVFVRAEDLIVGSELQKLLSNFSGVFLVSKESANANGSSYHKTGVRSLPDGPDEKLRSQCRDLPLLSGDDPQKPTLEKECLDLREMDEVRDNRKKLKDLIHYVTPVQELVPRPIAVGEGKNSVNSFHPDFIKDNTVAWVNPKGDKELEPVALPPAGGSVLGSPRIKTFDTDTDHGNHIAGLIAGRDRNGVGGLLPNANLFLIDTNSPDQLDKSIEMAIARGIYVFNFSFTLQNSTVFDSLKRKMRTIWFKDYLFIAAAGNDGMDLANIVERVPVSWTNRIQNIIGVGASDWENNVLGDWLPDINKPNQKAPGSNYSKEYVQIVAPGKGIYSVAAENKYAQATGTSEAAPQVTAAAALLFAVHEYPSLVKARLIYTTDWFGHFKEKVWGGLLNFQRAVFEPDRNLLTTEADTDKIYEFEPARRSGARPIYITVSDGEPYDNHEGSADPLKLPPTIPFENILRLERTKPGEHRVIYLEEIDKDRRQLRILLKAVIGGKIPCGELLASDGGNSFRPENQCAGEIDVKLINNYVSKVPPEKMQIFF